MKDFLLGAFLGGFFGAMSMDALRWVCELIGEFVIWPIIKRKCYRAENGEIVWGKRPSEAEQTVEEVRK